MTHETNTKLQRETEGGKSRVHAYRPYCIVPWRWCHETYHGGQDLHVSTSSLSEVAKRRPNKAGNLRTRSRVRKLHCLRWSSRGDFETTSSDRRDSGSGGFATWAGKNETRIKWRRRCDDESSRICLLFSETQYSSARRCVTGGVIPTNNATFSRRGPTFTFYRNQIQSDFFFPN